MKLLFIENRHKTFLYEPITEHLKELGHEVHWLVQNKQFLPKTTTNTNIHIINYPTKKENIDCTDDGVAEVIISDRQVNHFQIKDQSYFYYYNSKIEEILLSIQPNFVFGESTSFHELLAIKNCKKHGILYLNPSTCRYPIGRFSFYKYDTLEPYLGSNETLTNDEASDLIDQIVNRKTAPDYMRLSPASKFETIKDKIKKTYAYIDGENYNTPNPLIKYKLEKQKKKNIRDWDTNAVGKVNKNHKFRILYPLQMQPEANLDVWGRPYRNQNELIRQILENLPKDVTLYVKPNPKSKYELSRELIDVVANADNCIALHHSTKMDVILPDIDLVITVTGTIAIECILNNKPVLTLIKTINNTAKNCLYLRSINTDITAIIESIKTGVFYKLSNQEKINFLNLLNSTSYKGIVSDPFTDKNCVNDNNINNLMKAFKSVVNKNEFRFYKEI
ncbi:capsular polysaccharide export protein, LipB/KpsS family [Winogradskyella thalassocola]|uniref:Capsule polysaccharide biosynthesis protein n=1 Tax=Winogradskyella thalassocola TaxID=262004 RepID=A0A1G7WTV0_9FLAO|nr:hypothetical protein [Winogradskyella thalassocola]SDG75361.1 Capsule polysaccharide biosynthesis protein [Winogradskyella thalassocola]